MSKPTTTTQIVAYWLSCSKSCTQTVGWLCISDITGVEHIGQEDKAVAFLTSEQKTVQVCSASLAMKKFLMYYWQHCTFIFTK